MALCILDAGRAATLEITMAPGGRRRATEPQRHGDGRREKGSDRKIISNPVHFLLNFTKKAIFIVFTSGPLPPVGDCTTLEHN
jgi:hypothetical protein